MNPKTPVTKFAKYKEANIAAKKIRKKRSVDPMFFFIVIQFSHNLQCARIHKYDLNQ